MDIYQTKHLKYYLHINCIQFINLIHETSSASTTQFHIVRTKVVSLFLRHFCSRKTEHKDISKSQSRNVQQKTSCSAIKEKGKFISTIGSCKILRSWHSLNCIWLRRSFNGQGIRKWDLMPGCKPCQQRLDFQHVVCVYFLSWKERLSVGRVRITF